MNKETYEFPIDSVAQFPTHPLPLVRNFIFKGSTALEYCADFRDLAGGEGGGEGEVDEEGHLGGSVTGRENVRCERNDRKQIPLDEREMNI